MLLTRDFVGNNLVKEAIRDQVSFFLIWCSALCVAILATHAVLFDLLRVSSISSGSALVVAGLIAVAGQLARFAWYVRSGTYHFPFGSR